MKSIYGFLNVFCLKKFLYILLYILTSIDTYTYF